MRSARVLRALTSAARRHAAFDARPLLSKAQTWRGLASAPSNPFEIDLNALNAASTTGKLTVDDAKRAAATQQAEAQREIDGLHAEMSTLFGEEVAEYGGDNAAFSEEAVAFEQIKEQVVSGSAGVKEPPVVKEKRVVRAAVKPKKVKEVARSSGVSEESSKGERAVDVLLLQGPCSFVRDVWTGGDVKREELQKQIQDLADELKIVVKGRNYDSESIVLKMLLDAREDQVVVLCWNISLSKSPFIIRALELVQSRVIVVSPSGVEHGSLPANVVGVLSGFWNQSISLALNAASSLRGSRVDNKSSVGHAKAQTPKAKSKFPTCYLCGEVGHIRSKCPQLPRNKA